MRQIVLDTETTGLEPEQGHRIIEIGCLEIVDRRLTGNHWHHYLQPDRDISAEALAVHGIDQAFLADKPRFADLVDNFLAFVEGAELLIHNAAFDIGFINHELGRVQARIRRIEEICTVCDTLRLARKHHPGARHSLDALCKRYQVDASGRQLHGAALDARLLAEVYLAMTGGQVALRLDAAPENPLTGTTPAQQPRPLARPHTLLVFEPTPAEKAAHEHFLQVLDQSVKGECLWRRYPV